MIDETGAQNILRLEKMFKSGRMQFGVNQGRQLTIFACIHLYMFVCPSVHSILFSIEVIKLHLGVEMNYSRCITRRP